MKFNGKTLFARVGSVAAGAVSYEEQDLAEKQKEQTRANIGVDAGHEETSSKYFDIDHDGIISLKPEYRGDAQEGSTPVSSYGTDYIVSDRGLGFEGSKIAELPAHIVIPENVNGEQVTGFVKGMFYHNRRIKSVVLPSRVKTIINGMFWEAIHLEKVENTEQIETIGAGAFYYTRVKELHFPNLLSLGTNAFKNCSCLRVIDLGNITSIGTNVFFQCENLSEVLGGSKITTIGKTAFYQTRRLKSLPFLANVTKISEGAFWSSRCDLEAVPSGCTLGAYATYKQYEDNDPNKFTDYWSAATFTPCKNTLNSLFHQRNPQWADKQIGNHVKSDGSPVLYRSGCALITLAEIYSAFENVHFDSPEEFYAILESKGLADLDFRQREPWCQIANGLGYETEYISVMTTESLQKVYDALVEGALLYKSTMGAIGGSLTTEQAVQGGHAILGYGINAAGEMLVADSSMHCDEIGIYENHKTAWHIYKHGSLRCDVVIVKKPK